MRHDHFADEVLGPAARVEERCHQGPVVPEFGHARANRRDLDAGLLDRLAMLFSGRDHCLVAARL